MSVYNNNFGKGSRVKLVELKNKNYDGLCGTLLGDLVDGMERVGVRVELDGGKTKDLAIRPQNIVPCSQEAMGRASDSRVEVELPDGRFVNIGTEKGALEFLEHSAPHPCSNLTRAIQAGKLPTEAVLMLGALARALGPNHVELFSDQEIADVSAMYTSVLLKLASSKSWKETGQLDPFHYELIGSMIPWSGITKFTKTMLKKECGGYKALARVMEAPLTFPCADLCEHVLMIIGGSFESCIADDTEETLMYKLDKVGLLAQGLRALTAPVKDTESDFLDIVNLIMRDHYLIKKRLQPGMATRKILDALLDGSDGYKADEPNPNAAQVRERLKLLQEKCDIPHDELDVYGLSCCRKCKAPVKTAKVCKRCKNVVYCGRDCQVADWKVHKKYCKQYVSNATEDESHYSATQLSHVTQNWISGHLMEIMPKVWSMDGAQKDFIVIVDLQDYSDPPIVIKKVKDVISGKEMPKWQGCENNPMFVAAIKERQESMNDNMLLFLHRSHDTDFGVCAVTVAPQRV